MELEQFAKVDCLFKPEGCTRKVRKDLLEQHQDSCCFNYAKFGPPFSLCKAMNLSCNFRFNQGNLKEFVNHFICAHGAKMTKSMEFQMKLCNFLGTGTSSSAVKANTAASEVHGDTFEFFTPIVTYLEENECYLVTLPFLNTALYMFQIVSYYLPCFNSEKTLLNHFKMEYSLSRADRVGNLCCSGWSSVAVLIQNPINLMEAKDAGISACSSWVQVFHLKSYLTGHFLLVDCKILPEGNAIKKRRNVRPWDIFKCRNITQILKSTKTVKVKRLSDFKIKGDSRALDYLERFQEALLSLTPDAQNRVLEIIDLMVESVIFKDKAYLLWEFGQDKFEWILHNAMFRVVEYGSVEALKRMMGKDGNGLDWGVIDDWGEHTLLHLTMSDVNLDRGLEKARLLLNNTDVQALDERGRSLAHYAAQKSNDQAMAFVCQLGLDINAKNNDGNTPLHLAMNILHGVEITAKKVEVLLKHGADPDAQNEEGKTPLDVAASLWNQLLWEKVTGLFQTHYMEKWKADTEKIGTYLANRRGACN